MLNWYANTFRISEENITKAGLRRTKIFAWLMLLIVPLETIDAAWLDSGDNPLVTGLIILALVGLFGVLLSPLVHRFWARDKYLDEWEIEIKRKGMSAGYKVLFGALVLGLVYSSVTTDFSVDSSEQTSLKILDGVAFALLILAFATQTLTQIYLIKPIDETEVETDTQNGHSVGARIAVVFAIFMLFFGAPFVQGFVDGFTEAINEPIEVNGSSEDGE